MLDSEEQDVDVDLDKVEEWHGELEGPFIIDEADIASFFKTEMDFYDDVIKNRFYSYDIDEDIYENMNEFLVKFQDMIREFGIKTMMSLFST